MATRWAKARQMPAFTIRPDWATFGDNAALQRNTTIIEAATALIAFPNSASTDTWDTIRKAHDKGIPIHIYGEAR